MEPRPPGSGCCEGAIEIQKLKPIPLLRNGARLTADEFRRRYEAMPPGTRAELIDGEVFITSPVSAEGHGKLHSGLGWFLTHYTVFTPAAEAADNSTIRLSDLSEPQPDHLIHISPDCGGQVQIDDAGFILGAPEMVAEVSASSVDIDLTRKFDMYRRHGSASTSPTAPRTRRSTGSSAAGVGACHSLRTRPTGC